MGINGNNYIIVRSNPEAITAYMGTTIYARSRFNEMMLDDGSGELERNLIDWVTKYPNFES